MNGKIMSQLKTFICPCIDDKKINPQFTHVLANLEVKKRSNVLPNLCVTKNPKL